MSTTQNDFYSLTVSNLKPEEADDISFLAFEAGALGVEEVLAFEQKSRDYEPVTLEKEKTSIKIYFAHPPAKDLLENLQALYPQAKIELVGEANRDWLAEWKKSYQPFLLCGRIWVVPSWCEVPLEAEKAIRIDPEMAFGTGTHETTQLAAGFLHDFSAENSRTLLDVGTGTGILAILAEWVGFAQVTGNDIDADARRVARENLEKNKTQRTEIVDLDLSCINGEYDWVVANIIDGVLVRLQDDLKKRVAQGGFLLLTGILNEREELFLSEFSFEGFRVAKRRIMGEWVGYLLQKKLIINTVHIGNIYATNLD